MFKTGALTAEQAMQLLSGADRPSKEAVTGSPTSKENSKRQHDTLTPSKDSEAASPAPKQNKGELETLMQRLNYHACL